MFPFADLRGGRFSFFSQFKADTDYFGPSSLLSWSICGSTISMAMTAELEAKGISRYRPAGRRTGGRTCRILDPDGRNRALAQKGPAYSNSKLRPRRVITFRAIRSALWQYLDDAAHSAVVKAGAEGAGDGEPPRRRREWMA